MASNLLVSLQHRLSLFHRLCASFKHKMCDRVCTFLKRGFVGLHFVFLGLVESTVTLAMLSLSLFLGPRECRLMQIILVNTSKSVCGCRLIISIFSCIFSSLGMLSLQTTFESNQLRPTARRQKTKRQISWFKIRFYF